MTNDIVKCGLILWMYIVGVWAVAVPALSNELGLEEYNGLKVIKYDGPLYEMTEEDKASLRRARVTGEPWERPADMPVIELKEGTMLDLGVNGTLTKRAGSRMIGAFGGYSCAAGTLIASVTNFGCGTGCITILSNALSGQIRQEYMGRPFPTMDVFQGGYCKGIMQHFGVTGLDSCTNDTGTASDRNGLA